MAKPTWITKSQKISTINELEYFTFQFQASNTASYTIISGELPNGLQLSSSGLLQGIPSISQSNFSDSIYDYRFTVRAIGTESPYVIDRTFSISVNSINPPDVISPATNLGIYEEGDYLDIQIVAVDQTPESGLTYTLANNDYTFDLIGSISVIPAEPTKSAYLAEFYASAQIGNAVLETSTNDIWLLSSSEIWINLGNSLVNILPLGLTLTNTGRLYGYFLKSIIDSNLSYNFAVDISDGVNVTRKNFILQVNLSALSPIPPILLNEPNTMLPAKHDNFYSYQFTGYDFDDEQLEYFLVDSSFGFDTNGYDSFEFDPPEFDLTDTLVLDPDTGWLYGYLPKVNRTNQFKFLVGVRRVIDSAVSQLKEFTLIVNEFDNIDVNWITPSDLGTVYNGSISNLAVQAEGSFGGKISYSLLPYNLADPQPIRLPQGIRLTSEGLLVGRFSFRSFSLDNGNTTISDNGITTYGELYRFTVLAEENKFTTFDQDTTIFDEDATLFFDLINYGQDSTSRNYRTFTVKVINRNPIPYENLYLKAYPTKEQRQNLNSILQAIDWLDDDYVYRASDPYYGRQRELKTLFLPGINVTELNEYISAIELNHYKKSLKLTNVKLAQATDDNLNQLYEIIYVDVEEGEIASNNSNNLEIDLFGKLTNYYQINEVDQYKLYPNTFKNMRARLLESLDLERRGVLPKWMTSVQRDGSILGFTYAIPLAYVKPGYGLIALQKIKERIANDVESISYLNFVNDRYHVDKQLTKYWDFDNNQFLTATYTKFYENNINRVIADQVDFAVTVPFDSINNANLYLLTGYIVPESGIEIVSPQVYVVTYEDADSPLLPGWSTWMNDNAVWFNANLVTNKGTNPLKGTTQIMERDFRIETAGAYFMSVMNTDSIKILIDGNEVADIVGYNVTDDPANWFTTFYLSKGKHTITITTTISNIGSTFWPDNPKGFAVRIYEGVNEVFSTRTFLPSKIKLNAIPVGPGLDGYTNLEDGQTLIFARQDNYPGYTGPNNGWNLISELYDGPYDEVPLEDISIIPGLTEKTNDIQINKAIFTASIIGTTLNVTLMHNSVPLDVDQGLFGPNVLPGTKIVSFGTGTGGTGTYFINNSQVLSSRTFYTLPVNPDGTLDVVANQRAGIWSIDIDISGIINLNFVKEVQPGDTIRVTKGDTYGGKLLLLNLNPPPGRAELNYFELPRNLNNETIFDGGDTEFIENRELYLDPGRGDKYIIYPKLGVFE